MAGFLVSGCGINPRTVTDIPSIHDYSNLDCNSLAAEKSRIEKRYIALRWSAKSGTRHQMALLNGQAFAVTDQIHTKDCKIAAVRIPGDPWPEVDNDTIRP